MRTEIPDDAGTPPALSVKLTAGAIKQGYIVFYLSDSIFPKRHLGDHSGNRPGEMFELVTPTGKVYHSDIRIQNNQGRIRKRFTALFKSLGAQPGDVAHIVSTGTGSYSLQILHGDRDSAHPGDRATPDAHATHGEQTLEPSNTILYGPPGTGKTFRTSRLAVTLCDGPEAETASQEHIRARYDELQRQGRISFVTFHQSYGYEEFVEGLRPEVTPSGQVSYRVRPGAFKKACEAARTPPVLKPGLETSSLEQRSFFKMSLGAAWSEEGTKVFDYCVENDCVLLGWGEDIDFTGCSGLHEIEARIATENPQLSNPHAHARMVNRFIKDIHPGDLIVVSMGNQAVRAIAEVTGGYEFAEDAPFQQMRSVRWLAVFPGGRPVDDFYDRSLHMKALYRLRPEGLDYDAIEEAIRPAPEGTESLAHVFIIDEINRANISKVFGELITLLEPDKREGQANAVSVRLPYSHEPFSVPANLHVIGTMNTADRSIALLDTALRRRFDFEEVMPDPACLAGQMIEGIDLEQLLSALNDRIEALFDRDHTIGHAYFIGVTSLEDLQRVFRRRVIPLLQEYFHENWARIRVVLNDHEGHFVERNPKRLPRLEGDDDLLDDEIAMTYRVNPIEFPVRAFQRIYAGG